MKFDKENFYENLSRKPQICLKSEGGGEIIANTSHVFRNTGRDTCSTALQRTHCFAFMSALSNIGLFFKVP